jgi:hypothetical protein
MAGILIQQQRHMPTPVVPPHLVEERLEVHTPPLGTRHKQPAAGSQVQGPEDDPAGIAAARCKIFPIGKAMTSVFFCMDFGAIAQRESLSSDAALSPLLPLLLAGQPVTLPPAPPPRPLVLSAKIQGK